MSEFNYVFHLSHIDLDGYGCQYLTKQVFKDIKFYNANYGAEVTERLEEIYSDIKNLKTQNEIKPLILITDLNLTTKECNKLEKEALNLGAKLLLLDHHATGINAAERFAWYNLDETKSATLITYEYLKQNFSFDENNEFKPIVEAINAIDIWVDKSEYFNYGRVLLGMISGAREVNRVVFASEDREYKLFLIDNAKKILNENRLEDAPIILDERLHFIKKEFFKTDKNDTKDNLVADYITQILTKNKDKMSIEFMGKKGILTYSTGNTSLIGNNFLVKNEDFDFYMDVNSRGQFSLRSNNKVDVSKIAQIIGDGGGHPNASGGKIEGYKDYFVYSKLKEAISDYLKSKESNE
jgi:oligoribonuclease NrnB/cAMP/cGMP phosphodiesterase (DHH superfamily)